MLKCVKADSIQAKIWLEKCNKNIVVDYHFCKYGEVGCIMPSYYKEMIDFVTNFKVRQDDIWVITFPKCGTTWTQEMVWQINELLDFERAKENLDHWRFPYFERCGRCKLPSDGKLDLSIENTSMAYVNKMKSPRYIKSHLHFELLPKEIHEVKPKIIYVARNVKDVVVSYYHDMRYLEGWTGTLDEFVEAFITDNVTTAAYWPHLRHFWNIRHQSNILFLTYEEMKTDLRSALLRVAKFLNKELNEDQIKKLIQHLSFEEMKKNPAVNKSERAYKEDGVELDYGFIRKGKIGSWKEELSQDSILKLNIWITKNKIEGLHDEYY